MVWSWRVLHVRYRRWAEPTDVRRRLEPYGLVLKAGRWYVVAGPGPRSYRVDQILQLLEPDAPDARDAPDEEFTRPDDFDLAAYWTAYQRDFHARLHRGEALVRLALGVTFPRAVPVEGSTGGTGDDGWTTVRVPIESVEHAHGEFLRLGADIEVLEPAELRGRMARTATELAERYGNVAGNGGD